MIDLNSEFAAIRFSGADARSFLQAQLAGDLNPLKPDQSVVSAALDPQGRVLCVFVLVQRGEDIVGLLHPSLQQRMLKRLRGFVFRAKVAIEPESLDVAGLTGCDEAASWPALRCSEATIAWPGERALALGQQGSTPAEQEWTALDIRAGLPWLDQASSGEYVGQMLDLDLLGAINFKKGCYPGQEVVARVHFRGRIKRGLAIVEAGQAMEPGQSLLGPDGAGLGELIRCARLGEHFLGLAVVHLARADESVSIDGQPARMTLPHPRV